MDFNDLLDFEKINVKDLSGINEKWIQDYIANKPSVLGLGELELKAKEKIQPNAGRLDLLLEDTDDNRRYEVELQLGKTDESHIIRTIEYWDIERRRYPQYDHCAVIIAENITTRFLNVIQLFNGHIPLIAIQMNVFKVNDKIAINFTKILDEVKKGLDVDEIPPEETDRNYWEIKGSKETVALADDILKIIKKIEQSFEINYNKHYIGLKKNNISFNFVIMYAKKSFLRVEFKMDKNEEIEAFVNENGLDVLEYNFRNNRYKIRLSKTEITEKEDIIKQLLEKSYEYFS